MLKKMGMTRSAIKKGKIVIIATMLMISFFPTISRASTITIDSGNPTDLLNAINDAAPNDTILISGTYTLPSTLIMNKSITLTSTTGAIISSTSGDNVFKVSADNVTLSGITINYDSASISQTILVLGNNFTIDNCMISGALYLASAMPNAPNNYSVTDCTMGQFLVADGAANGTFTGNTVLADPDKDNRGIGFRGVNANVPWYSQPILFPAMTGNTFKNIGFQKVYLLSDSDSPSNVYSISEAIQFMTENTFKVGAPYYITSTNLTSNPYLNLADPYLKMSNLGKSYMIIRPYAGDHLNLIQTGLAQPSELGVMPGNDPNTVYNDMKKFHDDSAFGSDSILRFIRFDFDKTKAEVLSDFPNLDADHLLFTDCTFKTDYVINYLEKDTNISLQTPKTATGSSDDVISSASEVVTINGYTYDSTNVASLKLSTDSTNNVITLYYKKATADYTVQYLEKGSNMSLSTAKVMGVNVGDNISASNEIIPISEYTYDSASVENLTIGMDSALNFITLYYVKDVTPPTTATYTVHYLEKGSNTVLAPSKTGSSNIGDMITASGEIMAIANYNYDSTSVAEITLVADSALNVITLYYVKVETLPTTATYTVHYLEKGSNAVLAPSKTGSSNIGDIVTASGEIMAIANYNYDSTSVAEITLVADSALNVITLYYVKTIPTGVDDTTTVIPQTVDTAKTSPWILIIALAGLMYMINARNVETANNQRLKS